MTSTNATRVMTQGYQNNCLVTNLSARASSDNEDSIITADVEIFVSHLKVTIFIPILFFVGAPTNCVSMVVFYKLGLKQRINLSLFSLSLADFLFLCHLFVLHAQRMTSKASVKGFRIGTWQQIVVNSKLVGIGGVSFWVSQFLSAVIACERCFCVLAPLRANGVLKTRTMAVIIAVGSLLIAGAKAVSMEKHRIECVLDVEVNITRLVAMSTEFYTQNKAVLDIWDGLVSGVILLVFTNAVVLVATIITTIKLREIVAWRQSSSSILSEREITLTRMLIYLSIQLNILSFPNIVGKIASMFVVDFAPNGKYQNSFFIYRHLSDICAAMNSSLNFFVYLFAGSKYRETLRSLLTCRVRKRTKYSTGTDSHAGTALSVVARPQ